MRVVHTHAASGAVGGRSLGVVPQPRALAVAVIRHPATGAIFVDEEYDSALGRTYHRASGGGIEFGERAAQILVRELAEEYGIQIVVGEQVGVLENLFILDGAPDTRSSSCTRRASPTRTTTTWCGSRAVTPQRRNLEAPRGKPAPAVPGRLRRTRSWPMTTVRPQHPPGFVGVAISDEPAEQVACIAVEDLPPDEIQDLSLYTRMIEELARHSGHADILREQILAARQSIQPSTTR